MTKGTSGEQMGQPTSHGMDKAAPPSVPRCLQAKARAGCSAGRLGEGTDQKLLMESNGVINSSRIFQNNSESGSENTYFSFLSLKDTGYVLQLQAWSLCSLFESYSTALCLHGAGATYLWKETEQTLPLQRLLLPSQLDNPVT